MPCIACQSSNHWECFSPVIQDDLNVCCCGPDLITNEPAKRGGPVKAAEDMVDPKSTGRKRAALVKPIEEGMECEWAHLARAGGGVIPIVGCAGNEAKHIHHGPDKDTTNNDPETNLWRVCTNCHNRWHTLNDPYYGTRPPAGTPFVPVTGINHPHDPETTVDHMVMFNHELWWTTPSKNREPYINAPQEA